VDGYLIHWPLPQLDRYVDSWRAMIKLCEGEQIRSIGVSNFTAGQLDRLEAETGVVPTVNQVEMHPGFPQDELLAQHKKRGIQTMAYSPLGRGGGLLDTPLITSIAAAHGVTPAQLVLRWHIERGVIPLPRSSRPAQARREPGCLRLRAHRQGDRAHRPIPAAPADRLRPRDAREVLTPEKPLALSVFQSSTVSAVATPRSGRREEVRTAGGDTGYGVASRLPADQAEWPDYDLFSTTGLGGASSAIA